MALCSIRYISWHPHSLSYKDLVTAVSHKHAAHKKLYVFGNSKAFCGTQYPGATVWMMGAFPLACVSHMFFSIQTQRFGSWQRSCSLCLDWRWLLIQLQDTHRSIIVQPVKLSPKIIIFMLRVTLSKAFYSSLIKAETYLYGDSVQPVINSSILNSISSSKSYIKEHNS